MARRELDGRPENSGRGGPVQPDREPARFVVERAPEADEGAPPVRFAGPVRFGIPAAKMGLGYRASWMKNLVDIVGAAFAREIMITGRQFTASEAKEMGLINKITSVEGLEKAVKEYCETISGNAPLTMSAAKRIIREVVKTNYDAAKCKAWAKECFDSEDYKEGRKAFMEKRKPAFKGR